MDKKDFSRRNISSNFLWRLLEQFGAQGVTLVVSVVLARILDPAIYGTVALISVLTTVLQVFVDSGFGNALVQKKDADDLDFSTVFIFNIILSIMLYVGFFFLAPGIAAFYNIENEVSVIRFLGLIIIIAGFKGIQQAYVSKHLLYKKFFFATLGGTITAAIVGIFMAYKGFGIWALVGQNIANQTMDTIILWITIKWKPKLRFSLDRFKKLFSYGWKFLATGLLNQVYDEIRTLIIGKKYSSADLAFYKKGNQFPAVIANAVTASVDSVLLPVMSDKQENISAVKNMTRRAIRIGSYVLWPCLIGLAVCAKPFISLLLTEKWLFAVPYLQIFCITYAFYPIQSANLNAIKALGRSDIYLYLDILKKVVGLSITLISMPFGVIWMAIGALASSILSQIINSWPNRKLLGYHYGNQLKDMMPQIGLSCLMGAIVYSVSFLGLSDWLTLLIQIPLGVAIYTGGSILFKIDSFTYILGVAKSYMKRK